MIEFLEEEHIYLLDGVIIPSVSEILHFIFPRKYANVDKETLNKKAEYGTIIHNAIECIEKNEVLPKLDNTQEFSINQYLRLKEKNNIEVVSQEQMITYKNCYAGRFDMLAKIEDKMCLCDIKTTAVLDKEYLSYQLSFYELAYRYTFGIDIIEKLYAIWLPKKGYGELVEIKRKSISELLDIIKKFYESKEL